MGIPGEKAEAIDQFKANNGLNLEMWIDNNSNYQKLIPPGGRQFPLEVVIDRKGNVVYLENAYYPGEAIKAVLDALKD